MSTSPYGVPKDPSSMVADVAALFADPEFENDDPPPLSGTYAVDLTPPRNFFQYAEDIFGLARPGFPDRPDEVSSVLDFLREKNVSVLISLSDEEAHHRCDDTIQALWEGVEDLAFQFFHIETVDPKGCYEESDTPLPGQDKLNAFKRFVEQARLESKLIAVYCAEGIHRTPHFINSLK